MSSPYIASLSMLEARDLYFKINGFGAEGYSASTFTLKFGRIPVKFPNTASRKRVLPLHDFHHILTGYGTDWIGEAEIGAWELRGGCRSFIAYFLNGGGVILGLFISPRRVLRAFRAAKEQHTLYLEGKPYSALLELTVGDLRQRLGIPAQGLKV